MVEREDNKYVARLEVLRTRVRKNGFSEQFSLVCSALCTLPMRASRIGLGMVRFDHEVSTTGKIVRMEEPVN